MNDETVAIDRGDCPPREQLELLTANKLGPENQAMIATHVQGCTMCQQTVASLNPREMTEVWQPPEDVKEAPLSDSGLPEELRQHSRYRVVSVLGRGGMGTVYKAEHRLLERAVVLKVIRPDLLGNSQVVQRFQREARLAARLNHPNIVAVYEAEQLGNTQLLVMEFIEGVNISELVSQRGLLPVAESCEMIRQAAEGLQHVHEQGLVHRDIKPANLLVSPAGIVKILDLGLATLKSGKTEGGELTADHQFLGTVDYAAPEQWASSRDVDIRADIYSLGCTLYYMLAGQSPFPSSKYNTVMQQMWAHSQAPLPPIRDLRPDVPEAVAEVVTRMLAKDLDQRFASPREVAEALLPFVADCNLAEFVRTARRTTTSRLDLSRVSSALPLKGKSSVLSQKGTSRRALLIGGGVAACAALATVLAIVFGGGGKPDGGSAKDPGYGGPGVPPPVTFSGPPIKIGILHSRTGFMAINEKPVIDATLFAVDEINHQGGVLGRKIEAVIEDGASDWPTFALKAEKLISQDKVAAVFGCWTSASRKTVKPIFEKHKHLLFYPVQYEGLEESPNIIYTGAAPNQQIIPAVKWCVSYLKKKRLFLVGSDYVFPRAANAIIRDQAKELEAEIVGEEYLLLGNPDTGKVIKRIQDTKPEVILNTINGDSNVTFFRALRAADITPEKIPTISFSITEDELTSLNLKAVVGDYAAWNYFQSIDGPKNEAFVSAFRARFGPDRNVSDPMEAAYLGVHVWAQAVRSAKSDEPGAVCKAIKGQSFVAPEGTIRIDPETQHTSKFIRIGRITNSGRFDVVYCSDVPINPVPYPNTRSKSAWNEFLTDLQLQWGGEWANPGKK